MSIVIYNYSVTGDCSNTGSGEVYFNITGTTPPFAVNCIYSGCSLPTSAATTSYSATSLTANTYFLQIVDGASNSYVQAVYISSGTTASIDSQNTTCGLNNGVITGFTSGVYNQSTYDLYDGSNNFITSASTPNNYYEFTSLSAGTYYIVANDGGGCTGITASVIITPSTGFTFGGYVVDDASCNGVGSGKIFLTGLTLPSSAYTINWSPNVNGQTGTTVTGLTGGTYIVTLTDPNDCSNTQSFTVQTVNPLGSGGFITIFQPTCFSNDGEVEFIVTGGTPPYFFSGSSGQVDVTFASSVTFTGLSSGNYSFLVTDAGLCTIYDSVTMLTPNSFSTVAVNTTPSFCSQNDGSIQVVVDNGLSSEPSLIISVSGTSGTQQIGTLGNPSQTFVGLPNGTYVVTVQSTSCTYTASTTITSVDLYSVTASTTGTTCGTSNGVLQVNVSTGGTLPYIFTLVGPTYAPVTTTSPVSTFTNLAYGNYTLTVQDSGSPSCVQTYSVYIDNSQNMFFNLLPSQPVAGNDGSITTYITSGEPPFTLNWSSNVNGQTGTTVTGLTAGTYSLSVTDSSGCTLTKSVILTGTKKYIDYRYYTVCDDTFRDSGLITKRGMRSMYLEGFSDLTSGDTNCIINEATFSIYAQIGSQSAQTEFYTSSGSTDYPSDTLWSQTIVETLDNFLGISGTTVDIISNRITITTTCEDIPKGCEIVPINPLQDNEIIVKLLIDYDISCVSCS
jgi:hypothetical protein